MKIIKYSPEDHFLSTAFAFLSPTGKKVKYYWIQC